MSLYKDASLVMIPSAVKDGKLYSIRPTDGSGDFTFSRGSNLAATRVDVNGLIEKGRENLLLQSNQFDTTWSGSVSVASGYAGYDGNNDAWLLSKVAGQYLSLVSGSLSNSGVQTYSIYCKAATLNLVTLFFSISGGGNKYVEFDLTDGSVNAQTSSGIVDSGSISIGNGWYRLYMTFNNAVTDVRVYPDWANSVAGGVYIQDAQLEKSMVATDYIETGASTAQAGILEDLPRLDYSGGASCPALLLEPQRSNKFLFSEYYGSGALAIYQTGTNTHSVTNNYAVSPEGVQNAIRFVADITSVDDRVVLRDGVSCGGGNHTLTFYAKSNTSDTYTMKMHFDGSGKKQIQVTPEWQRFEYGESANSTCNAGIECSSASGYSPSVDISVYGFQLEENLYPTSYIPTYGSAVTRSDDYMQVTPTDLLGSDTGTWFMELDDMTFDIAGTQVPTIYLGDSTSNCLAIEPKSFANNKGIFLVKEESNVSTTLYDFTISGKTKFCFVWSGTTLKVFRDGIIRYSSSSFTQPANWDTFVFNHGTREAFSEINSVLLFPTALTDSECIALTTL